MPELPEVECLTRGVREILEGRTISRVVFYRKDLREPIPVELIQSVFQGAKIQRVYRRSKYMLLETDKDCLLIHLGMTGNLIQFDQAEPRLAHTHCTISIDGGKTHLHYVDPRRFGVITYSCLKDLSQHRLLKDLGPEPLENRDLADYLWKKSRKRSVAIKNFLMNAKVLVGVGNIYASESLFLAGVRPTRPAGQVKRREMDEIAKAVKHTLKRAIKAGGTSFRDFKNADGNPGYFSIKLNVYGRTGEPCKKCEEEISMLVMSNRSTYYCRHCQS